MDAAQRQQQRQLQIHQQTTAEIAGKAFLRDVGRQRGRERYDIHVGRDR
jgi:hypothetical protein